MKRLSVSGLTIDILVALAEGPNHAYAITQLVRQDVQGASFIAERSIYKALERMEAAGLISRTQLASDGTKITYHLSEFGRKMLIGERAVMRRRLELLHKRLQ